MENMSTDSYELHNWSTMYIPGSWSRVRKSTRSDSQFYTGQSGEYRGIWTQQSQDSGHFFKNKIQIGIILTFVSICRQMKV